MSSPNRETSHRIGARNPGRCPVFFWGIDFVLELTQAKRKRRGSRLGKIVARVTDPGGNARDSSHEDSPLLGIAHVRFANFGVRVDGSVGLGHLYLLTTGNCAIFHLVAIRHRVVVFYAMFCKGCPWSTVPRTDSGGHLAFPGEGNSRQKMARFCLQFPLLVVWYLQSIARLNWVSLIFTFNQQRVFTCCTGSDLFGRRLRHVRSFSNGLRARARRRRRRRMLRRQPAAKGFRAQKWHRFSIWLRKQLNQNWLNKKQKKHGPHKGAPYKLAGFPFSLRSSGHLAVGLLLFEVLDLLFGSFV